MDAKYTSKVYINPNYKPLQGNKTTPKKQNIYINQNFVETNILSKNVNKIFVNPNFINTSNSSDNLTFHNSTLNAFTQPDYTETVNFVTNTTHLLIDNCTHSGNQLPDHSPNCETTQTSTSTSNENLVCISRYTLVRSHTSHNIEKDLNKNCTNDTSKIINSNSHVPTANSQLTISKSRYQLVRRKEILHPHTQTPEKPRTLKISKYKVVRLDNSYKKMNIDENYRSKLAPFKFTSSQKFGRPKSYNSGASIKNITYNGFKNPTMRTRQHKKDERSCNLLKKNANYLAAIENIKGKSKINNKPCPLFTKYGKCLRNINGECVYLHDKKHVSLCRRFLHGICHDTNCCLSHELTKKKMPTCYFYLKGMCVKENCPYLHVKLNETTKICRDFITGYCEKGEMCLFRHIKQQIKASNLRLHLSKKAKKSLKVKKNKIATDNSKISTPEVSNTSNSKDIMQQEENAASDCRYFKDAVKDDLNKCDIIKPSREKLGVLPPYIKFC